MKLREWIDKQPDRNGLVIERIAQEAGVTPEAVSQWVYKRHRVPAHHCITVERITGGEVSRESLRPDVFVDEEPAA